MQNRSNSCHEQLERSGLGKQFPAFIDRLLERTPQLTLGCFLRLQVVGNWDIAEDRIGGCIFTKRFSIDPTAVSQGLGAAARNLNGNILMCVQFQELKPTGVMDNTWGIFPSEYCVLV